MKESRSRSNNPAHLSRIANGSFEIISARIWLLSPSRKNLFRFSRDTLRFGNNQGDAYMTVPEMLQSGPIDYMLDVILGGDFYGADDAEKVKFMITDIDESVYGRRAFCWDEIRLFTGLKELTIMPWDENEMAGELMKGYRDTLRNVASSHPEWVVPRITVVSATSGTLWGTLEVEPLV